MRSFFVVMHCYGTRSGSWWGLFVVRLSAQHAFPRPFVPGIERTREYVGTVLALDATRSLSSADSALGSTEVYQIVTPNLA